MLTVLARPFPAVPQALLPEGAVCTREADLLQIRIPEAAAAETLRRVCGFLQKEYAEDSL